MCVITGEKVHCCFLPFPLGGQSAQSHTTAPLEVIIFQCSVEQMMQTWGLNRVLCVTLQCIVLTGYTDYVVVCYLTLTNVIYSVVTTLCCTLLVIIAQSSATTQVLPLLFRCGPPRYRPSAVQSTIFCCQANKWLVSVAVSVYWLLILSLSRGWSGALHSPPLCSVTGKVLTLLISFFTALCQNIQLRTLKTSAIARHLQPHTAPLLMVDSLHFVF